MNKTLMKPAAVQSTARQGGFSLIELMVAIAIGLIMLALLAVLFANSSASRMELERVTRLMENARFGVDSVGDDIRHAGYFGPVALPSNTVYTTPSPCATAIANFGFDTAASPVQAPAPITGIDQPPSGYTTINIDCLTNRLATGTVPDVLIVRRVSSDPITTISASSVVASNLYMQASQCAIDAGAGFKVSNNSADFNLRTVKCINGTWAPARRYFARAYYVASCNNCSPSDNIPTLKRVEVIDGVVTRIALAEGVLNLQFEYGFDTNGDGAPDEFRTDVAAGTAPNSRWENVVAVRAHMLVRSTEQSNVIDGQARQFDLGTGAANLQCPTGFRCRLVTTTFRLNNVAGRRES